MAQVRRAPGGFRSVPPTTRTGPAAMTAGPALRQLPGSRGADPGAAFAAASALASSDFRYE